MADEMVSLKKRTLTAKKGKVMAVYVFDKEDASYSRNHIGQGSWTDTTKSIPFIGIYSIIFYCILWFSVLYQSVIFTF